MAQLTYGIKVEWVADNEGAPGEAWALIPDITKIPTLVGTPSTHDVTTIYNAMKNYINGLADNGGTLAFSVNFTPEIFTEYDKIKTAQTSEDVWFRVAMPAPLNKAYQFTGTASLPSNDELGADAPITGTFNITPSSDIELVAYTPGKLKNKQED